MIANSHHLALYGIPNCDTVKKARNWLANESIEVVWIDFKKQPPTSEQIAQWSCQLGWQNLLKKTGTTWRNLAESERDNLDEAKAVALMHQHINLLKRPLLLAGDRILLAGFKQAEWETYFANLA